MPPVAMGGPSQIASRGPRALDVTFILVLALLSVLLGLTIERSRRLVIRAGNLPKMLAEAGWTPEAVANHVAAGLEHIRSAASTPEMPLLFEAGLARADISVPTTTLSVTALTTWLGEFVGLSPRSVTVELVSLDSRSVSIWLRSDRGEVITSAPTPKARLPQALAELGEAAAAAVAPYNVALAALRTGSEAQRFRALEAARRAGEATHLPVRVRAACLALAALLTLSELYRATPRAAAGASATLALGKAEERAIEEAWQATQRALALFPDHPLALVVRAAVARWRSGVSREEWKALEDLADAAEPAARRYFGNPDDLLATLRELSGHRARARREALEARNAERRAERRRQMMDDIERDLAFARSMLRGLRNHGDEGSEELFIERMERATQAWTELDGTDDVEPEIADRLRMALARAKRLLSDYNRAEAEIEIARRKYADTRAKVAAWAGAEERRREADLESLRRWAEQGDGPPAS